MAMSMPPPVVPGFSLRVQLYSPNAHSLSDKPLQCFRVVTSPEATVREFCEEASRIHEINYGEPIAIKKCQDDQEFDITQSEVLGTIFTSAATIRVIQAGATPGVRDSVPPTSALRFDPANHLGRKRGREGSPRANGSASSSAWQPNKRQRVSDLDPDKPLPSREMDADVRRTIYEEEEPRDEMVPDSQQEATHVGNIGNSRYVRDVPRISETPSPPPDFVPFKNGSADRQGPKSNAPNTNEPLMSEASIPSPFGPASTRAQNAARSKSASYHIQRATERGTSVSTAATSPLSGDLQAHAMNGTRSSNKREIGDIGFDGAKLNGKPNSRSENEDSTYENVPSDSEASAIMRRTKDKLKGKSNSPSGLPGLDWAKNFNTPPTGSRRTYRSQERVISNAELPLTPSSKECEERKRQKEQAEEARKARVAAAEAAEQRKREADEARAAEDRERIRKMREKSERETQEKRNAVIAKATRLEQERLDHMERDRKEVEIREAEEKRREQEGTQEETKKAERLVREKKARIAKERQEVERVQREKAKVEEAERAQEDGKRREKETALAMETVRKSREQSEQSKTSTPDRSRATPIRPQSSTPFIPSGRKSALKVPSSQAAASLSPELIRTVSAGSSNGSRHESERRVSFDLSETPKKTPIRPPILPPFRPTVSKPAPVLKTPTLKAPTPKPPVAVTKEPSPKPSTGTSAVTVRPVKQSTTPILPPAIKRSSSTTPLVQSTIVSPRPGATTKPAAPKNTPVTKSISPAARSVSQNREIPNGLTKSKEPTKSASPPPMKATLSFDEKSHEEEEEDDEDNDNLDGPNRIDPVKALNTSLRSPAKPKSEPEPKSREQDDDEEDESEDVEMQDIQSNRSSSRSPVVFNSHAIHGKAEPTNPGKSASSTSDESNDENESVDEESSDSEDEASDDVGEDEDKTITAPVHRSSPPSLPATKPTVDISSEGKPSQMSSNAMKSTPIPIPSSSNAARPKSSFASLSSLAKNFIVGHSSSKTNGKSQPLKLAENDDEDSEDESDEQSDADSSSNSDEEPEPSQSLPIPKETRTQATDSDDSDSDSGSGSDKESEDDEEIARNELSAQIAKMVSDSQASTQSYDTPTPKVGKGSQDSQSIGSGKERKKLNMGSGREDKYLTKYAFSQPR